MVTRGQQPQNQIPMVQTSPDSITLHRIEDHELETFMNISRPYSLAFSTTAMGAFLGLLPSAIGSFDHADKGLTPSELITIALAAGCLATAVVAGIYAVRGLIDANRAVKRIRARPKVPC